MSFANQVAVITGASSGIGMEVAKELARNRCHVGLIARRREKLYDLAEELSEFGVRTAIAPADVADGAELRSAIRDVREELGPIDLLLANAGISQVEPLDVDEAENIFRVNTLGVVYAVEAVLPEMMDRGSGHIAAVSSLSAYKGFPGHAAYCGSKAAVNSYMEALRLQLRKKGVAVSTICPGFIRTPMTSDNTYPMPFLMNADKAARRIVRALRRKKKVYNFPRRTSMLVKMLRWLPDWMVARILGNRLENHSTQSRESLAITKRESHVHQTVSN